MNIQFEKTEELIGRLTIDLAPEDYRDKVRKSLNSYSKKVTMKGFRQGMVPVGMVRKLYGDAILLDQINEIIGEAMDGYLKEKEIQYMANPILVPDPDFDPKIDQETTYKFEFEVGLTPEFTIQLLDNKPEMTKRVIRITPEMVDEEIEMIKKRNGEFVETDHISEESIVSFTISETDAEGNPVEGGINHDSSLPTSMMAKELFDSLFSGKGKGEKIAVNPYELTDKSVSQINKQLLGIDSNEKLEGKQFQLTISEIKTIQPAEENEEFFKRILGDNANDLSRQALEQRVKDDLAAVFEYHTGDLLFRDILERIFEETKFDLPESFLVKWYTTQQKQESGIEQNLTEEEAKSFIEELRRKMILDRVQGFFSIELLPEEVEQSAKNLVKSQWGIDDGTLEHLWDSISVNLAKNKEFIQKAREQAYSEKFKQTLTEFFPTVEEEVTFEEFKNIINK